MGADGRGWSGRRYPATLTSPSDGGESEARCAGSCFARAIWSEQRHELAGLDLKVQAAQDGFHAKTFDESLTSIIPSSEYRKRSFDI